MRATDCEIQNSLLFAVLFRGSKSRVSIIPDAARGCAELSVARHRFQKKFTHKFADKFTVPRTPVNLSDAQGESVAQAAETRRAVISHLRPLHTSRRFHPYALEFVPSLT